MSVSRIALSIANAAGSPSDATVVLSDISGSYGIQSLADDDVVVPAGTALERLYAGRYEYQILLEQSQVYRYALKITQGSRAFYLRGYLCPHAQSVEPSFSESESESDSESESPVTSRSVRLIREDSARGFVLGQANSHRLRIRVVAAEGITRYLLGHLQRILAQTGEEIEQFAMIVSPRDIDIYPVNTPDPDQSPAYYRKDYADVILPNADVADRVWLRVKAELDNLIASLNRLAELQS